VTGGPGARTAVAGAVLLAASVAVMWALGRPQTPAADTAVRTVADCAAVVTLGAAVVPWLDDAGRRRAELVERAGRPLLIGAAVWAVKDLSWVEPLPLGLTLIVTHLGLLLWELRYVSASLAFPGLKPGATKESASR